MSSNNITDSSVLLESLQNYHFFSIDARLKKTFGIFLAYWKWKTICPHTYYGMRAPCTKEFPNQSLCP